MEEDPQETVLPLPFWIAVLVIIFCWPSMVLAEPVFAADADGIRIVLYNEPCQLRDQVSNLPARATWTEGNKTYEGCVGANPNARLFVFYFSDRSAVAVPMQAFQRLTGA